MARGAWILVVVAGLVLSIFVAGFFPAARRCEGAREACPPAPVMTAGVAHKGYFRAGERDELGAMLSVVPAEQAKVVWATEPSSGRKGLLALANSPDYRRAAELSLKVEDCTKAEDALEGRLQAIKGEIVDMLMEGTEGSRTCTLTVLIPADKFREFVGELRKMGKVQAEKITASRLKPGEVQVPPPAGPKDTPDPRELSLVAIRMADEKIAQTVLESRGLLAASFDHSASHFMNGLATLVEAIGYVLPYFIVLLSLAVPVAVVVKLRRAREVRIQA